MAFQRSINLFFLHFYRYNKLYNQSYITEDHVLHFINQYMLNNYSIDIPHSKQMYSYIKHLLHKRFLSEDDDVIEDEEDDIEDENRNKNEK